MSTFAFKQAKSNISPVNRSKDKQKNKTLHWEGSILLSSHQQSTALPTELQELHENETFDKIKSNEKIHFLEFIG